MKIFAVGMNYSAHVAEMADRLSGDPAFFVMPDTALLESGGTLPYPAFTRQLEYETELVIRLGRGGRNLTEAQAAGCMAGVTVGIDFTARDLQTVCKQKGLPWDISKSFDGAAGVGRFIDISQNIDIQKLHFGLHINGQPVQQGWSGDMTMSVTTLIAHLSQYFTLQPGDLLFTGTPKGVGPVHPGDLLEARLENQLLFSCRIG